MMKNFNDGFIDVIDNFLPKYTFQRIQELVLSTDFFWHWTENDYNEADPTLKNIKEQDIGTYMMSHVLYIPHKETSPLFKSFLPITDSVREHGYSTIRPLKFKLNMYTNQGNHNHLAKHKDFYETDKSEKFITGVLGFTNDNGATVIGDKEFKTKENTMVLFDGNLLHGGYTQTDTKRRVILNVNYEVRKWVN